MSPFHVSEVTLIGEIARWVKFLEVHTVKRSCGVADGRQRGGGLWSGRPNEDELQNLVTRVVM
jgi:hypothetical protein